MKNDIISEIKERKSELEKDILNLIREFTKETGLIVTEINLEIEAWQSISRRLEPHYYVKTKVEL